MQKKTILVFLGLFACVLLSCTPPIEGELTVLVDWDDVGVTAESPAWSSDGSKVFFISTWDSTGNYDTSRVWCVDVNTGETTLVSPEAQELDNLVLEIDIDPVDNRCLTYWPHWNGWIRVFDTETWTQIESIRPPEDYRINEHVKRYYPRFSYESNRALYYFYHNIDNDSSYLHKVNLEDSTDEVILTVQQSWFFAPGPGDTLFAIGDTVYNLNTNERISMGLAGLPSTGSVNWNPANSDELVIAKGEKRDLYVYNLETRELTQLKTDFARNVWIEDARFSPDGNRIVFSAHYDYESGFEDKMYIFDPAE